MKEKILSVMAKYNDKKISVETLCIELHYLKQENQEQFFLAISNVDIIRVVNELLHRDNNLLEKYVSSKDWDKKRDSL